MKKSGLGRGLAALISDSQNEAGADALVQEVPVARIAANPSQPRTLFDPIKLEELTASIREHGVLQPVLLRRVGHDRYQLLAGERRLRAARAAGLNVIPALVKECTTLQQLEISIVENLQREDIGAMEQARAYRQMADEFAMTQEAIAARVGKSRAAIANTLGLLDLPAQVQESIETGVISEGHARALKGLKHKQEILEAWGHIVKRGLSVRDTEKYVRDARSDSGETNGKYKSAAAAVVNQDAVEKYLVNRLQETLKTKVTLRHTAQDAGRIEIEFYSREDLERVFEVLLADTAGK